MWFLAFLILATQYVTATMKQDCGFFQGPGDLNYLSNCCTEITNIITKAKFPMI